MEEGIERAALTIDAGLAAELLEALRAERAIAEAATAAATRRAPRARRRDRRAERPADRRERRATARPAERRRGDRRAAPRRHPGRGRGDRSRGARRGRRRAAAPRPIAERLARPGLHLIAEIKRSSPSAGRIAAADEDIVARARAYEAGGAAAISVLCEPHWFGGSVDDLRAVRAAVAVPVLAKDFVVEEIQLPMLRPPAPTSCCCWPSSIRRSGSRVSSSGARSSASSRWSRSTTHASSSARSRRTPAHRAQQPRPADARRRRRARRRLRELVPDDRLVIAESGVREPAIVARWRALGFDGALVGEALVRSADPAAAVRSFVAAGAAPTIPPTLRGGQS